MLLRFALVASIFFLSGCALHNPLNPAHTTRVTELYCAGDFDAAGGCQKIRAIGSDIDVTVNTETEKVHLAIIRNDGNWWQNDYILDHCSVVDSEDWKCETTNGLKISETYGMSRGHFYRSLVGGDSPDIYDASVTGWGRLILKISNYDLNLANRFLTKNQSSVSGK